MINQTKTVAETAIKLDLRWLQAVHGQPEGPCPDNKPDHMADIEMIAPIDGEHEDNCQDQSDQYAFAPDIQSQ